MSAPSTPHSTPRKRLHVSGSGSTPSGKRSQNRSDGTDSTICRPLSFGSAKNTRSHGYAYSPRYTPKSPAKRHVWTKEEERALIEYIDVSLLDENNNHAAWPMKNALSRYWDRAAEAIQKRTNSNILLTSDRVRNRARRLREQFNKSLEDAAKAYGLDTDNITITSSHTSSKEARKTREFGTQTAHTDEQTVQQSNTDPNLETALSVCKALPPATFGALLMLIIPNVINLPCALSFGDDLFSSLATARGITTYPTDFFSKSVDAMMTLQHSDKPNVLYKFASILSTKRPGTNIPLLQLDRMPFGLIEYQIEFYHATNVHQINTSADFAAWLETMTAEGSTRFMRLFRGPGWSGVASQDKNNPLKARMNVAAPSLDTIYRRAGQDKFDGTPKIQIGALEAMAKKKPGARVWFKADACDLKVAIQTSTKGKWSGDVDLGDGSLQKMVEECKRRVALVKEAGKLSDRDRLETCLRTLLVDIEEDMSLLARGLTAANEKYQAKFQQRNSSVELLKMLSWERVEFNTLLEQSKAFRDRYERLLAALDPSSPTTDQVSKCLLDLCSDSQTYLNNLFKKKREAADHALVIMVADERRQQKPYAVPIQLVPYHSIRDQQLQDLLDICHVEAKKLGLIPVGDVTDGEFNSLRTLGKERPIHIYEVIRQVKDSTRNTSAATILKFLRKVGEDDHGLPLTQLKETSIPPEVVQQFHQLTVVEGMTEEDAVVFLRGQLSPPGYSPATFRMNSPEGHVDRLRSILATFRYRKRLDEFAAQGIDMKHHMYVPEQEGGVHVHRREDHCHILKRIAGHLRAEPPHWFNPHALEEALHPGEGEPKTGLTEAALFGLRKQSVKDAETLISYHVATFLRHKGYAREADYMETVAGWHEAADGRGLTEDQRKEKNLRMMDAILDELMPWHRVCKDLSRIDINKFGRGVLGWSRETLIAVTTNIESMELRRKGNAAIGYEEHPRAGTTDDVEGFFAGLHRHLGNTFTLKQLHERWPTEVREFSKRIDPDLPFYYWTVNERYRALEDPYASFNEEPEDGSLRLHRLRPCRREDASIFTSARGFLPVRNRGTIRQLMHRPEVPLPEVPNTLLPV
ncbi:Hypp6614 [Branchiostoma lanceolatum]|uniref:Hypp6614 protein n=1 Tax=Branchiostoma lanceolatum TaxID=7740 RepID=A0A8K0EAF9_BRALA|nr:Hypp6614 [Branchiostoma lanceolatum]